jgi:molybdopterin-guanine dinucleotide biosynthesis protein A
VSAAAPTTDLVGAVLAGGGSRRLGRDKSAEPVGDARMIDRAVAALRTVCREVFVVSSRPDTPQGPWERIPDRLGHGPLAGIEAALAHGEAIGAEAVLVLACDLPLVGPDVIVALRDRLGHAHAAAVAREGRPDFEPLCALYRVSALARARDLLADGDSPAHRLFEDLDGIRVQVDGNDLLNVNTERDLERARDAVARLESGS